MVFLAAAKMAVLVMKHHLERQISSQIFISNA